MSFVGDDEMCCENRNATVENRAPEMVCSESHNCPFFKKKCDLK